MLYKTPFSPFKDHLFVTNAAILAMLMDSNIPIAPYNKNEIGVKQLIKITAQNDITL